MDILLGGYFQFDLEIIGFYAFSFFYDDKNDTSKSNGKDNELENIFFIICRYLNLEKKSRLRLWSLMPLSTIFQLYGAVSFIDGGNQSTRRKPPTCCKPLTNFIIVLSTPCLEWGSNSLVVIQIGTDCTGSCKSNYHTITMPPPPPHMR